MRTATNNSAKSLPLLDQRYIDSLREKDLMIQQRIEKRQKAQETQRQLAIENFTKTIETLTTHKKDMQKLNAIFQSDMRSHVEKFHREIAKVYTADDNLRETKRVTENYLRKFKPQMAIQLKSLLQIQDNSLEAKIFNVKNHAPIIINQNNELIRLETQNRELEHQISKEEVKNSLFEQKSQNTKDIKSLTQIKSSNIQEIDEDFDDDSNVNYQTEAASRIPANPGKFNLGDTYKKGSDNGLNNAYTNDEIKNQTTKIKNTIKDKDESQQYR